jgi:hypothetical protein
MDEKTARAILEVPETGALSQRQVMVAFRAVAKQSHPDMTDTITTMSFTNALEAKDTLVNNVCHEPEPRGRITTHRMRPSLEEWYTGGTFIVSRLLVVECCVDIMCTACFGTGSFVTVTDEEVVLSPGAEPMRRFRVNDMFYVSVHPVFPPQSPWKGFSGPDLHMSVGDASRDAATGHLFFVLSHLDGTRVKVMCGNKTCGVLPGFGLPLVDEGSFGMLVVTRVKQGPTAEDGFYLGQTATAATMSVLNLCDAASVSRNFVLY